MSNNRGIPFNSRTAARLLDGSSAARAAVPGLGEVLSALTAPAAEAELLGEHAAMSMFTQAALTAPTSTRSPSMIKVTIGKLLAAKVLAGGFAVAAATGGIALASSAGVISNPIPKTHVAGAPTDTADIGTGTATTTATGRPTDTPSPSLMGMCHAYQAGATANPGKAMASPAFAALVTAAGGAGNVGPFCIALVGEPTSHPTGHPGQPATHPTGEPTDHPTGPPATHPTGEPTDHPTGPPATHPTGQPTDHPTGPPASHPTGQPKDHPTGR